MKLPDADVGVRLHAASLSAAEIAWGETPDPHTFARVGEGHYQLDVPECLSAFDLERLYRDRNETWGELVVSCRMAGARTFNGNLFSGNINLSSPWRRRDVVTHLKDRANTKGNDPDWGAFLDELSARVIAAERAGEPPQLLSTFDRPKPDDMFDLEGIVLPRRHASIVFGDGGTFKSYLALFIGGCLAQQGVKVLFADWELDAPDHRERLQQLFGSELPQVYYRRYQRPLIDEAEGIRRFIEQTGVEYVICDSVGFAANGAPESAEAATTYFQAVRQFGAGVGSLHLAHVTKPKEDAADPTKPFGSVFWHNSARSTWFVKRTTDTSDGDTFSLALIHRKANLGSLRPPVGLQITFEHDRANLRRIDIAEVEEFARGLPVPLRVRQALKGGARTVAELVEEVGGRRDTIEKESEALIGLAGAGVVMGTNVHGHMGTCPPDLWGQTSPPLGGMSPCPCLKQMKERKPSKNRRCPLMKLSMRERQGHIAAVRAAWRSAFSR